MVIKVISGRKIRFKGFSTVKPVICRVQLEIGVIVFDHIIDGIHFIIDKDMINKLDGFTINRNCTEFDQIQCTTSMQLNGRNHESVKVNLCKFGDQGFAPNLIEIGSRVAMDAGTFCIEESSGCS